VRRVMAMVRASWLTALSYRLETFFSFFSLVAGIVPLYLISRALEPTMAGVIRVEAPQYFAFLIVGLITYTFVGVGVTALHSALSNEISTGSFEALVSTPTRLPVLLAGLIGQQFSMNVLRQGVLFGLACACGARVVWTGLPAAFGILAFITLAHLPIGVFAAALVLAFRTTGPFPATILSISALLGGVYYPTTVIPSWLERVSAFVPLSYGLRALRRTLLDGAPLAASARDLTVLAASTAVLLTASLIAFSLALRHAKHAGTLAQY